MEVIDYNKLAKSPAGWAKAAKINRQRMTEKWTDENTYLVKEYLMTHTLLTPTTPKAAIHNDRAFIAWEKKQ